MNMSAELSTHTQTVNGMQWPSAQGIRDHQPPLQETGRPEVGDGWVGKKGIRMYGPIEPFCKKKCTTLSKNGIHHLLEERSLTLVLTQLPNFQNIHHLR